MTNFRPDEMIVALQAGGHKPSASRRLAAYYDAIEACLEAGYRHEAMHAFLGQVGLEISFKYYQRALARLRKSRTAEQPNPPALLVSAPIETRWAPPTDGLKENDFRHSNRAEGTSQPLTMLQEPDTSKPFSWDAQAASKTDWKNMQRSRIWIAAILS